jgi:hypothetical protein
MQHFRLKSTAFRLTGPYNVTGEYWGFIQHILLPSPYSRRRYAQNTHKKVITTYQTIRLPNTDLLWILTTLSTSNPVPKKIKNNWSMDGNVTLGKLNYKRPVCFSQTQYLILYTFSTKCVHIILYVGTSHIFRNGSFTRQPTHQPTI